MMTEVSMKNKVKCTIWNREFELNVVFQNFPGEEVTANQEKISDSLESFDFDISLAKVKEYIPFPIFTSSS